MSSSLRKNKKPEWQDTRPKDEEQRDAYDIANKHFRRFSAAFLEAMNSLNDISFSTSKLASVIRGSIGPAHAAAKLFPRDLPEFNRFGELVQKAYSDIIQETGQRELERLGFIAKADDPELLAGFDVDNPYSRDFMRKQTAFLVAYFSKEKQKQVAEILKGVFLARKSSHVAAREIMEMDFVILPRHQKVVERRTEAMFDGLVADGIDPELAVERSLKLKDRETKKFKKLRAAAIARTETVRAQASGLVQSWQVAKSKGFIDKSARKEWIAAGGSERTCAICQGLDGEKVDLNQNFSTGVAQPPAHVMCRCTMGLIL